MFVVSSNSEASKNKIRYLRIILILNALREASHIIAAFQQIRGK